MPKPGVSSLVMKRRGTHDIVKNRKGRQIPLQHFIQLSYPFLNIPSAISNGRTSLAHMAMVNTETILVEFLSLFFIYSSLLRKNSFNLSLFAEHLKLNQYETRAIFVGDILNMNYSMQELMILRHSKTIKQKNHNL